MLRNIGLKTANFEKITILITAYVRRQYLPKLLKSLNVSNLKIVLLDSSPTIWSEAEKFSWVTYKFTPNKLIYKVMHDAAKHCTTPYILWLSDDDLLDLNGLWKCLYFIDNHKNYSSVTGKIRMRFSTYTVYEYRKWLSIYNNPSDDPLIRLEKIFNCFVSGPHDVMRRECFEKCFEIILENPDYYPVKFLDRVIVIVQSIYGNKKILKTSFINRRKTSQLEWNDYPMILQKDIRPEFILKVIKKNDPFSELMHKIFHKEVDFYKSKLFKILNNYFEVKNTITQKSIIQKIKDNIFYRDIF